MHVLVVASTALQSHCYGFHPTTHKVSLQTSKVIIVSKTRASYYSHHLSQSALHETN